MKISKKILIILGSIFLLLVLLDVGLNTYIKNKLPELLNSKKDAAFHISYKDADFSLLKRRISANDVKVIPTEALKNPKFKKGIFAEVKSIEIINIDLYKVIFKNTIKADKLIVLTPKGIMFESDQDKEKPKSNTTDLINKIIYVSNIVIKNGTFQIINDSENTPKLNVANIDVEIQGILVTDNSLKRKLPFDFSTYDFSCDSIYFRPSKEYHISAKKIKTNNTSLIVEKFAYAPEFSRPQFVKRMKTEKDIFGILADTIKLNNMKWGFVNEEFFFKTESLVVENPSADIYRPKMPADDLTRKKMYSELLRGIPFDMKIDTLKLNNAKLVYEEEKGFDKGPGILSFDQFYMKTTGITSAYKQNKVEDVKIRIDCRFMKVSPFKVNWSFNVLDKSDAFNINGTIFDFPAADLAVFTKPYTNTQMEGILEEVRFNFNGNNQISKGTFELKYDDLKVEILRKDRERKNKVVSAIANIFVKKSSKEELKKAEVAVDRIPEKSFFNLLWISIADGLKQILI
ncbi:hypothetical protein [Flavobacterium ardleyense]|uniref:hypothetical protein n=1 Tax=Flavobacterium ardleyense TaxID=2038737 RepID=UPI00298CAAE3|nr:hypothetical protein [Flavobacterium ardleyense]